MTPSDDLDLPQGDVRLLDSPIAQRLLGSAALARFAYVARDGCPPPLIVVRPTWVSTLDFQTRVPRVVLDAVRG